MLKPLMPSLIGYFTGDAYFPIDKIIHYCSARDDLMVIHEVWQESKVYVLNKKTKQGKVINLLFATNDSVIADIEELVK